MVTRILIVDDEPDFIRLLERLIRAEVPLCEVFSAVSGSKALELLGRCEMDVVCLDIRMPDMNGFDVLSYIRSNHPLTTVIMITAYGCIEIAVKAIKEGAYDFITKPLEQDVFLITLKKALERVRLLKENLRLRESIKHYEVFQNIVGASASIRRVFDAIRMVAPTDVTVLIRGESGTGKELVARAIHELSDRRDGPFIPVNCPAVPDQILESELFGYKKGAFTHAVQDRKGLFQEAQKGTIFLDEIGDIPMNIQTKLLRVLQEKEIKPLGDTRTVKVDVRVVASTNQDLEKKIAEGTFREDLFYRLNVVPIFVPPLRERREDIPLLTEHFLKKYAKKFNKPVKTISSEAMKLLMNREWKGNVRELENTIMRGILFSLNEELSPDDLSLETRENSKVSQSRGRYSYEVNNFSYREAKERVLQEFHTQFFGQLLSTTGGNISQAAKLCGLERQALQYILKRYGIQADRYRRDE
ncbi:MAG: sigma-54 dependent transcriptional regulator [Syntrophobacterales bacterium]|nr:sigma-54 dependent transcriptional regulator [Syntrophobacterales bacterium]